MNALDFSPRRQLEIATMRLHAAAIRYARISGGEVDYRPEDTTAVQRAAAELRLAAKAFDAARREAGLIT